MKKIWAKLLDSCGWLWELFKFACVLLWLYLAFLSLGTMGDLVNMAFAKIAPWWVIVYAIGFIIAFFVFVKNEYFFLIAFVVTFLNLWLIHFYSPDFDLLLALMPCSRFGCPYRF